MLPVSLNTVHHKRAPLINGRNNQTTAAGNSSSVGVDYSLLESSELTCPCFIFFRTRRY